MLIQWKNEGRVGKKWMGRWKFSDKYESAKLKSPRALFLEKVGKVHEDSLQIQWNVR